jgi:ATP-binding cassette, subfamily B (MDR/TAP), member 1
MCEARVCWLNEDTRADAAVRACAQVIGNVRTVQAFVGEEKAVRTYREALLTTYKYGKRGGLAKGLGLGSMHSVLFLSWALLVWFTSIVVHRQISNGGESFTTMLNVVIAGL